MVKLIITFDIGVFFLKKRLLYFGISILCFLLCVLIVVSFSHKPVVRGFLGDIVVIVLIYYLAVSQHIVDCRTIVCLRS